LKATTVVFSNEVCSTFTKMSSRILLTDNVFTSRVAYQLQAVSAILTDSVLPDGL